MAGIDLVNVTNGIEPTTIESTDGRFNKLERTLEQFQENARHLGIIASDFTPRSQEPLNQKVHTMISGLQELDQQRRDFSDVLIPLELLDYLDKDKNPQLYTKDLLERTRQKNKEVNGKISIYEKFRACLVQQLCTEMPDVVIDYLSVRGIPGLSIDTVKLKQAAQAQAQSQATSKSDGHSSIKKKNSKKRKLKKEEKSRSRSRSKSGTQLKSKSKSHDHIAKKTSHKEAKGPISSDSTKHKKRKTETSTQSSQDEKTKKGIKTKEDKRSNGKERKKSNAEIR